MDSRPPTPLEVLSTYGRAAGLAPAPRPFPAGADLRGRLEEARYLMAPMAGVSDGAYRLMARAGGAGLAYTEMVSVAGIHYAKSTGEDKTWELALPAPGEPDIAVQLFGSKPEQFREAVAKVQERLRERLVLIDINMACPVPKVCRKGEGSALLDNPLLAAEIVSACVDEAAVPVTCKIRRSRHDGPEQAPEFARVLEDAGASAIAIHGRSASQLYRGSASWDAVRHVVEAVDVPVIGSGDVSDAARALRMRQETGCAAVMIARGSYGNPWIFSAARACEAGGEAPQPAPEMRLLALACHVRLLAATGGHLARARSLAGWYLKGLPHASQWRSRAMSCVSLEDYLSLVGEVGRSLGLELDGLADAPEGL